MSDDAGYGLPDDTRYPSDTNAPDEPLVDEDARLVIRLRNGDVDAFTTVFRSYYSVLVHFLRRYFNNVTDAEDVAQDTMSLVWERRQTLDPRRSLRALLFTMARNRALDHHRHRRRAVDYENQVQAQEGYGDAHVAFAADADVLADELEQTVARFVAELTPRQREIFRLSHWEGLSPAEIGVVLGITTQTVYVQLGRTAKALYMALDAWTGKSQK
jgi:RNA polymerase sigma-70 factor (ECF subfamily)